MSAPTRVLVTGSTGFVGRALVAHLRAQGIAVTAASRSAVTGTPDVRLVPVGELGPSTAWNAALEGCSAVVHLAARVHQLHDQAPDPAAEYRRINVEGTVALARAAAAAGVSRFIFMSSVKVHGESSSRPLIETDPLIGSDPYARSKAEAETALLDLAGPMQVMIIRPPLVYGAGVKANFLSMARWLARGVPLPLGAVTGNRRSLVALDNLVSLLSACLESRLTTNESFLASDGEDLSTADLLRRTAAALGVRARLIPVPLGILAAGARLAGRGDVLRRLCGTLQVDSSKARRVLGWTPPLSVDEGLRRAVANRGAAGA